jgi:hypothetical protein
MVEEVAERKEKDRKWPGSRVSSKSPVTYFLYLAPPPNCQWLGTKPETQGPRGAFQILTKTGPSLDCPSTRPMASWEAPAMP